jgi:hypothetical protein
MLLVIDGTIEVRVQEGSSALTTSPETVLNHSGPLSLPAGEGIAAAAGVELAWRTSGLNSATVVLVTLAPVDEGY